MALFEQKLQNIPKTLLKDKYGWPPFSVFNTMSWDWQRRKDEWENIGIYSAEGRDLNSNTNAVPTNTFSARGRTAKTPEFVSKFDPYLCELMYQWFSTDNMKILDPFAGGSVRGIVAAVLGRHYTGIDLSEKQIFSNEKQFKKILDSYTGISGTVNWISGDSEEILKNLDVSYDMIFTCPPYYNLEKYSNNPKDLSNLVTYSEFLEKYKNILELAEKRLAENSFFVIVVSEIRNSENLANSEFYGFVPDTIKILQNCGLKYYNEIILQSNVGSLPIRAPRYFEDSRKIGRQHQNILILYKGDITAIHDKFNG